MTCSNSQGCVPCRSVWAIPYGNHSGTEQGKKKASMFDTSDEAERQPAQPQYKDEDTKDKMEAWMSRAAPAPVFPESLYILPGDAESAEVDTGASKVDTFPAQTGDKLTEPPRLEPLVESPLVLPALPHGGLLVGWTTLGLYQVSLESGRPWCKSGVGPSMENALDVVSFP